MSRSPTPFVFIGLLLGAILFWSASPISQWAGRVFLQTKVEKPQEHLQLGWIKSIEGKVWRNTPPHSSEMLVEGQNIEIPIYHFDQINVDRGGNIKIELFSKDVIHLGPMTRVIFELWSPGKKDSPINMNVIQGDWQSVKKGLRGKFYIAQDKSLKTPYRKKGPSGARIIYNDVSESDHKFLNVELDPSVNNNTKISDNDIPSAENNENSPMKTLTNEYIDTILSKQQARFENCQTNALRNNQIIKGKILMEITVANSGKVKKVVTQQTNISNEKFSSCLKDVFKRVRFRRFAGQEIVKTYPIIFE